METITVVGASLAGLRAVETLRREGFDGVIVVVGDEPHLPYDRPPLSKEFLAGRRSADDIALRRQGVEELGVEWRLGRRARAFEPASGEATGGTVVLDDEECIAADGVVLATGSVPRRLPEQPELDGVLTLRTLDDARVLRDAVSAAGRLVVIGAGFIGAEVAATCREAGVEVTLLEALDAPMVRGLGERLGAALAELHRSHGVDVRLGVTVERFVPTDAASSDGRGRVGGIRLSDGEVLDATVVLVAIGVVPATRWLEDSGLELSDGVVCDETLQVAPGVVAAGDIARWPNPVFDGESMRLEHWTNATESGVHAARRLLGATEAFAPIPFVWSDQYGIKIQTVGRFDARDDMTVVDGDLDSHRFAAAITRDGLLRGAVAMARPKPLMTMRRMIGAPLDDVVAEVSV